MADYVPNSLWSSQGLCFLPNDEQLVQFLQDRLSARGSNGIKIQEVDVFGDLNPKEIFANAIFQEPLQQMTSENERYCFTSLKRNHKGGKRFARRTGGGTWKLQHSNRIIKDTVLKRQFTYIPMSSNPVNKELDSCSWVLYEYTFTEASPTYKDKEDFAVCKIKKNAKPISRKRDRDDVQTMIPSRPTMTQCIDACGSSVPIYSHGFYTGDQTMIPTVDEGDIHYAVEEWLRIFDDKSDPTIDEPAKSDWQQLAYQETEEREVTYDDLFSNFTDL